MKQYRQAVSVLVVKPSEVCTPGGECSTVHSILLVHKPRRNDAWQLPQGGLEAGETAEDAALRELQEETGLVATTVAHSSRCGYSYDFPPEFIERHKPTNSGQRLCFVVVEVPKDMPVKPDGKEIDSYQWVLRDQLPQFLERKPYRDTVERVLDEYLKKQN